MKVRWKVLATVLVGGLLLSGLPLLLREKASPPFRLYRVTSDPAGGGDATLSPDGQRFVATSRRSGNWDLWVYDIPTSRWSQLTDDPADDFEGRWSPDGTRLAFCSTRSGHKNLWVLTLGTGEVRQLTSSEDEDEYPAWSPDGCSVAYTGGPWRARDFFIVPAAGGKPRKVTREPGKAGACAFDPGGQSLVCHRYDSGTGALSRLWLDDGATAPLTASEAWDYKPTPSPDGRWIAFSRAQEGPAQICLLPAGGGKVAQLTRSPYEDRWPTWSAKGDRLLFHRIVDEGVAVKLLDRRSGEVTTLVGADESPRQASLDPQGRRLVYGSQAEDGPVLKLLDLGIGGVRVLDTGPGAADFPRWSPDGEWIAFTCRAARRWEVAVVRPDGSGRVVLTEGVGGLRGMHGPLDWSPDGSRVLFHADTEPFEASIYTAEVTTKRVTRLTSGAWFDEAPSWAPDGKGVVFMSTRGGDWTWGFFRLSLADGNIQPLCKPDWVEKNYPRQAPGGEVICSSYNDSRVEMLVEHSPGGKFRTLADAGGGARWPSYSADGSRILFTALDRRVEYWIAENLFGKGSPLLDHDGGGNYSACEAAPGMRGAVPGTIRSPMDLQRR
jgi:TolB protein